ncbi:hypothetical protein HLH33_17645 [Gluconacetobacter diazotrophicus]|uniref:Uncharacterized protein n=1 Tax=Gluconacetobacter diazotrophicus TaxID=33996 RepID=A0A7W4NI06_GLUDI|nr:hypothetical protein [Gluconacetobacter diazotrophicus]
MRKRLARDRDGEIVHDGEIGQPDPAGLVLLAEDHVPLGAVQRAPGTDPPLQRAADALGQIGMTPPHLGIDRDRPQTGRCVQQRDDLRVENIGQRIGPPPTTRHGLLRRQAPIALETIGAGHADRGLCSGSGNGKLASGVHEEPHLMIVDVTPRHRNLPAREKSQYRRAHDPRPKEGHRLGGAAGYALRTAQPEFSP